MSSPHFLDSARRAHQQGDFAAALAAARQLLQRAPDEPEAHWLAGTALLQLGQVTEAVAHLERSAAKARHHPAVLGALAQAYFQAGRYAEAQAHFRKAGQADPRNWQYRMGAANAAALAGRAEEAELALRQLAQRHPAEPLVWFNYGNVLRDRQRPAEALDCYERAVALAPDFTDARNNLGAALLSLERHAEAERVFRDCLERVPDDPRTLCNLASVLIDVGRFQEAEAACRTALDQDAAHPAAWRFLGAALGQQGALAASLAPLRRATELDPGDAGLAAAYGATLNDCGRHAEGMRHLAATLIRAPDEAAVHQAYATACLTRGMLAPGWDAYGTRPARAPLVAKYPAIRFERVLPDALAGATVCVQREQGLGDELFFLRYAPLLRQRGARVIVRGSDKIASLLARADGIDAVVAEAADWPAADHYVLAGDLPHALGALPDCALPPAAPPGYPACGPDVHERLAVYWPTVPPALGLRPLPERVAAAAKQLATLGPGPYVGLTWRAGTAPEDQRGGGWNLHKQVPVADLAATLAGLPGTLIAVQRKPGAGELAALGAAAGRTVHDCTALNDDLEGMLALLAVLDEYVAVSNTNVHLREGAGRPSRVLVPCPAEWRWQATGRYSPWFPASPTYRQTLAGSWDRALGELRDALAAATRNRIG